MIGKPILFSAPMVRAKREGRKTQTRRFIKPQPERIGPDADDGSDVWKWKDWVWNGAIETAVKEDGGRCAMAAACPYGQPGDLLWVRENFAWGSDFYGPARAFYQADHVDCRGPQSCEDGFHKWKPSIHMPRAASRLTLELTAVRVQRLRDISEEDAIAEGCGRSAAGLFCGAPHKAHGFPRQFNTAREAFRDLWESINGPGSWAENPWVWALTFTVHPVNIDDFLKEKSS